MAVAAEKKAAADARAAAAGETEEEEARNAKSATGKKAKTLKHGKKAPSSTPSSSGDGIKYADEVKAGYVLGLVDYIHV